MEETSNSNVTSGQNGETPVAPVVAPDNTQQLRDALPPLSAGRSSTTSYNSLLNRPRSNPRLRTPMRYESPLDPDAFRRTTVMEEDARSEQERSATRPGRISVRPMAGASVDTTVPAANRPTPRRESRSNKQGPSKRKVQRWNNENFRHLAAEISNTQNGSAVAEILLQAHADAHLYRNYYEGPKDCPVLTDFYHKESLQSVRNEFFKGEIGGPAVLSTKSSKKEKDPIPVTPETMMGRVNSRLKNIISRLHSVPSSQGVVNDLEHFLVSALGQKKSQENNKASLDWKQAGLTKEPTVVELDQGIERSLEYCRKMVQFVFKQDAGLSRLFLHAVCQFHGLEIASKETGNLKTTKKKGNPVKCLVVTGVVNGGDYRFLDHLPSDSKQKQQDNPVETSSSDSVTATTASTGVDGLTEAMSTVKVTE